MGSFRHPQPPASLITPQAVYLRRRTLLGGAAAAFAGLGGSANATSLATQPSSLSTVMKPTSLQDVTHYNNFYEFGTGKTDPAANSGSFLPRPWSVQVDGLVDKPCTFDLDTLMSLAPLEERVYRMRCVEAWSMVIPWVGLPLSALLKQVEPQGSAKYVAFESVVRPAEMVGQRGSFQALDWPYVEGLRLDEAMHPLTILAVGLYGGPCRTRMERRSGWSCPGSTASRELSRSCASGWSRSSRRPPGTVKRRASMASTPT